MKVFVVGMHRSGTSMVTGLLGMCGLYLGDNLKRPMRENPKGFFEDNEFVNINKEILRQSGGKWDAPPAEIRVVDGELLGRMTMFAEKWPKDRPVGLKDPRTCLTLGEWRRMVNEEIKIVYVWRDPKEIAASLYRRNGMRLERAVNLTEYYRRMLVAGSENWYGFRHTWKTHYANYFDDWRTELQKVCDFLGLEIPADTSAIEAFIEPKLRHHKAA